MTLCLLHSSSDPNSYSVWTFKVFDSFESISEALRTVCPHLKKEPDPLLTLMTSRRRKFCLPVIYAVCRLLKATQYIHSRLIVSRFQEYLFEKNQCDDGQLLMLFKRLEYNRDWKCLDDASEKCTFDTLIYCGMNIHLDSWEKQQDGSSSMGLKEITESRVRLWLEDMLPFLLECSTLENAMSVLEWIVNKCFPIVNTTSSRIFTWDPFIETWCLIDDNVTDVLIEIYQWVWMNMTLFMFKKFDNELSDLHEEKTFWWSELNPDWLSMINKRIEAENRNCFKIHEDDHQIRQNTHQKVLKRLLIKNENTNVPELYILGKKRELSFFNY